MTIPRKPVLNSTQLVLASAFMSCLCPWASSTAMGQAALEEVIVTAQKREQSIQDVPIAITALDAGMLEANGVVDVVDLSSLTPGFWVAPTAGASQVPQFSMRGATGNGVVPGSDRQVSIYIDGVYLSSPRGAIFDLPDIERIEVLRGPQGTLFGRNATAGAVSITTREPDGEAGVKAKVTLGNYNQERYQLSVDSPQWGPFSAYVSYINHSRDGDIRNTAAGQFWDRSNSLDSGVPKYATSPDRLGGEDSESWFAALSFDSGDFSATYRYDYWDAKGIPRGTGLVGYDETVPILGDLLTTLIETQPNPVPISPDGERPDAVSNAYVVERIQEAEGHSLVFDYDISASLSIRNTLAYRESYIFGAAPLDGFSSLMLTEDAVVPAAQIVAFSRYPASEAIAMIPGLIAEFSQLIGSPFIGVAAQSQGSSEQISDELQLNYQSDFLTATVGALWFNAKDYTNEHYLENTTFLSLIPNAVLPNENFGRTFNEITSTAGYTQLEFHLTPKLDLVAGARITKDNKKSSLTYGPNLSDITVQSAKYKKTKPNYLLGVNYLPSEDMLVYAKYSTAFVSGGSTAGIPYEPEEAESWEGGIKADWFNNTLRANLALYYVEYTDVQGAQSPTTPGSPEYIEEVTGNPDLADVIGTFVGTLGDIEAKGFELDLSAAPHANLTLGGNLGYTDADFTYVDPALLEANGGEYELIFRPEWTGSLWAQYDAALGSGELFASFRLDGLWQSDVNMTSNPSDPIYQSFAANVRESPAHWLVNARATLSNISVGSVNAQIALWGRNLTDEKTATYAIPLGFAAQANYLAARTYGVDLTVEF